MKTSYIKRITTSYIILNKQKKKQKIIIITSQKIRNSVARALCLKIFFSSPKGKITPPQEGTTVQTSITRNNNKKIKTYWCKGQNKHAHWHICPHTFVDQLELLYICFLTFILIIYVCIVALRHDYIHHHNTPSFQLYIYQR